MFFNEDLDYSDLTLNMRDLLSDIAFNMKSIYLGNLALLIEEINESYIDMLLAHCKRFILNEEYEGYCEGSICILIEFVEIFKSAS